MVILQAEAMLLEGVTDVEGVELFFNNPSRSSLLFLHSHAEDKLIFHVSHVLTRILLFV